MNTVKSATDRKTQGDALLFQPTANTHTKAVPDSKVTASVPKTNRFLMGQVLVPRR